MNRIKDLRIEKGINQEELGKLIGVTSQGMGLIENEKRKLDTKTASILADFFNVSIDYLITGEEFHKKWVYLFYKNYGLFFI